MAPKPLQVDPRIDKYISKSPAFAQPILRYLRQTVHEACPQATETMKWSRPHFDYKGIMCGMAAFNAHCTFGFWKGSLIVADSESASVMSQFGRITSLRGLPAKKQIVAYVHAAMKLNDDGVASPMRTKREPRKPLPVPADLAAAFKRDKQARETFDNFSPSNRREYIAWIAEAKTDETRKRRLATTIEWLAEGKPRNWKYMK